MTECPTDEQLAQLASGRVIGLQLETLEQHLDGCTTCRKLLAVVSNGSAPYVSPERAALQAGERLGRYEIERLIAAGGMGMLYVARDLQLHRRVALKLMRPAYGGDVGRTRLLREAQAMASLSHPNVVQVYELGEHDGRVFVAMELIDGGTLRDHMKKPGASWREVVKLFVQAGQGLAAAHASGVVHRDFKPENVLVGKDGRPRVGDFGLSRPDVVAEEEPPRDLPMKVTHTGTMLGTPAYMSPEQLAGRPADARSDQYGFCVSLYEALVGRRPFPADSVEELRARVTGGMPPPPKDGSVPAHVWAAIARGLHPDPAKRFPELEALLAVLSLDGVETPAPPKPRAVRVVRAFTAGFVALGLAGGGVLWLKERARSNAAMDETLADMRALAKETDELTRQIGRARIDPPVLPQSGAIAAVPLEAPTQSLDPQRDRLIAAKMSDLAKHGALLDWHGEVRLDVGETKRLAFPGAMRAALGDASIADVAAGEGAVTLMGLAAGQTTLRVFTDHGQFEAKVFVGPTQATPPWATTLRLRPGQQKVVVRPGVQRIAMGDPSICDVRAMGKDELMLIAGEVGKTTLLVWTRDGKRYETVIVVAKPR